MGRLDGKMAFVTGGAQGLGEATSIMFAREGAKVAVTDINLAGAQKVADVINAENPGSAFAFELDVTSEEQWIAILAQANDAMGGLNVLMNNAGIGGGTTVEDTDFATWQKVMTVDTDSVFLGCKYAIGYMKEHAPGSIINISSIAGLIAGANMAAYNAAKAAVWLLSKSVALHCAQSGYNIRSNSIHPTFIDTPILDGFTKGSLTKEDVVRKLSRQVPLGRIGVPNDVAYAATFLASDESNFITGSEIKIDGGISAM
ncbi:MAG: glucose 1-dehydrogenase [Parvibaculaceae bacterium]|nr:glucose 1-dehydrogenase [Parvibaculaceae bacterium]